MERATRAEKKDKASDAVEVNRARPAQRRSHTHREGESECDRDGEIEVQRARPERRERVPKIDASGEGQSRQGECERKGAEKARKGRRQSEAFAKLESAREHHHVAKERASDRDFPQARTLPVLRAFAVGGEGRWTRVEAESAQGEAHPRKRAARG